MINMVTRILEGLGTTLSVYLVTILLAIPLGLIVAVCKVSTKHKTTQWIIDKYIALFRGTPLLLQLYFVYFGLRGIFLMVGGYELQPFGFLNDFGSAGIAFVLNYTAYFAEIFRGGIQAVDRGQYEAAKAVGLTYWQSMIYVIIPQSLRAVLPSVGNEAVVLIKDTALVATIAMGDLLRNSKEIVTREATIVPFVIVAIIYLILSAIVTRFFNEIEKKTTQKYA